MHLKIASRHAPHHAPRYATPRTLAMLAAAGLAASAAADTRTVYRWWFPGGSPVTGNMADSSNWEDFVRPSTASNARNALHFDFAAPQGFTAFNDLANGLPVSTIYRGPGPGVTNIWGQTLDLRDYSIGSSGFPCEFVNEGDEPMYITAALRGERLRTFGDVNFDQPSSVRSRHTFEGASVESGTLSIGSAWHLGSVSGWFSVSSGGTLHPRNSMEISQRAELGGGAIRVDDGDEVTLRYQGISNGSGGAFKRGPGTLHVAQINTNAIPLNEFRRWTVEGGTLVLGHDVADRLRVNLLSSSSSALRLAGDNIVSLDTAVGRIELDGHMLTIRRIINSSVQPTIIGAGIHGDGVIRTTVDPIQVDSAANFIGEFRSDPAAITIGIPADLNGQPTLSVPQAGSEIKINGTHAVSGISGPGRIAIVGSNAQLTVDIASGFQSFPGSLGNLSGLGSEFVKDGSGALALTDTDSEYPGTFIVRDGQLSLAQSITEAAAGLHVDAPGRLAVNGFNVELPTLTGDGTLEFSGTTVIIGANDVSAEFAGPIESSSSSGTLRKNGAGTITLSGDLSGLAGSVTVNEGALRFTGQPIFPNAFTVGTFSPGEIRGHGELASLFWNQADIIADVPGETLRITGEDPKSTGAITATAGGIIELTDTYLEQDFTASFATGSMLADGGTVRFGGNEPAILEGGSLTTSAMGLIDVQGPAAVVRVAEVSGNITIAANAALTSEDSDFLFTPDDTLDITIAGDPTDALPAIRGAGNATLGGTLRVHFADDYTPQLNDRVQIIGSDSGTGRWNIAGAFDAVDLPDIAPLEWRVREHPTRVELIAVCPADLIAPFGVTDAGDLAAYVDAFSRGDSAAQTRGPVGQLDFSDLATYLARFAECSSGGGPASTAGTVLGRGR